MKRALWILGAALSLATLPAIASAADRTVNVHGGGEALVTDPSGSEFPASFAVEGVLDASKTAHGSVNFVFGTEFSGVWGAVPGVDLIHVWGTVTSITMARSP